MAEHALSRRRFVQTLAAAAAAGPLVCAGAAEELSPVLSLSEHLAVYRGPINVGILRDGRRAVLFDCGDGSVLESLGALGIDTVDSVCFTHHHRDQACGAARLASGGTKLVVPAAERDWFANVESFWTQPPSRWHVYNLHPHHLMLAESVPVARTCEPGQSWPWGPARITVLATPGHTDGSVSYLVEVDGRRVAFSGDAIYDRGRVWEIHSLQKGTTTTDYHGFLGAMPQLKESLARLVEAGPRQLIPSHGSVINDPRGAVEELCRRLDVCYDRYVAISALRHYFPPMFAAYEGRPGHMPIRPMLDVPKFLRHIGTTWLVVSDDGAALAMDCGGKGVIDAVRKLQADGEINQVEGLWVTHYHDDHVDAIPDFLQAFPCPCYADARLAEMIAQPLAWRLPCISPSVVKVDRVTRDGESWTWREFTLTAWHFPGQTLYHGGLLVEGHGARMFFTGDSFTPAGIDDYCTSNRNWLGADVGFRRCLKLLQTLRPTHLFNCHVDRPWDFTPEQYARMDANLAEREALFGQLVPWDHANFGMDEPWIRGFPHEQRLRAGDRIEVQAVVTNHADAPRRAACRLNLPLAWQEAPAVPAATAHAAGATADWPSAEIPAKTEHAIRLTAAVPPSAAPGRYVLPIDLLFGDRLLPQVAHAIVEVAPGA